MDAAARELPEAPPEAVEDVPRCLNCGHPAALAYCPRCGQSTRPLPGSVFSILRDFGRSIVDFDFAMLRNLRTLFTRPGQLTLDYLGGKRAAQVPPLRLYFLASFLFFLAFQLRAPDVRDFNVWIGPHQIQESESGRSGANLKLELVTEDAPRDGARARLEDRLATLEAQDLVDGLYRGVTARVPTMLVLALPLLALCLRALYPSRAHRYFEHLVFALHAQSFFLLLLFLTGITLRVLGLEPVGVAVWSIVLLTIAAPLYVIPAMARAFGGSRALLLVRGAVFTLAYLALIASAWGVAMLQSLEAIAPPG